jgi:hypothetical protein
MPFDHIETFNRRAVLGRKYSKDFSNLATLFASNDHDGVVFLYPGQHAVLLKDFGSKGNNLHKTLGSQLARYRAKNTCPDRFSLVIKKNCRVVIETNI